MHVGRWWMEFPRHFFIAAGRVFTILAPQPAMNRWGYTKGNPPLI